MGFSIFAYVAVLILVALLSTRLMKVLKLPNVTGYIITGILVGPFVFGLLFNHFSYDGIKDSLIYQCVSQIKWVSSVALGFIAFSIGSSFKADGNYWHPAHVSGSSLANINESVLAVNYTLIGTCYGKYAL